MTNPEISCYSRVSQAVLNRCNVPLEWNGGKGSFVPLHTDSPVNAHCALDLIMGGSAILCCGGLTGGGGGGGRNKLG